MHLHSIDWLIVLASLLICFVPALFFGKRAGKSTSEFFVSGRSVPWWLAGLSMVATTFSSDTPNLVTDIVRRQGVAGNWCWWAFVLTGVATVFFYARLWRRSGVMTDLEFYELRYSGAAASVVRGFRSVYLGLFFNCMIMATVNLAACKIAGVLFGMERWQTLLICGLLNVVFAAHSGLWGVLVIDMIQFFIKMTAVIAAAYFAVRHVGGLSVLVDTLSQPRPGPDGKTMIQYLNILPDFKSNWDMAVAVFIMPVAVQWWAVWYPGAEPGGGSYIAQRMLASKSEKDSLGAVLFFNVAHYVLRPWPWILVGLCSLLVYPELADIQKAFPNLDPKLLGHDIAYPAMLKFLPVGFIGLMVGGLIAANSSTILTHLNWGASYLVHDFYQRFVHKGASEKHYVLVGRLTTIGLFACAAGTVYLLDTAKDAFDIILQVGAGTGLLYLMRWFWWRVNAWCEVVAMLSSFAVSLGLLILKRHGTDVSTHHALLITIAFTTVCWVSTALLGPPTDRKTLIEFYRKVRPFGPGWRRIREEAGVSDLEARGTHENIPLALLGWVAGCTAIWSALFTVGNVLYGRTIQAVVLLCVFIVSGLVLRHVMNRLWSGKTAPLEAQASNLSVNSGFASYENTTAAADREGGSVTTSQNDPGLMAGEQARAPDFYLVSKEHTALALPRACWRVRRVRSTKDDDSLLVRVQPAIIHRNLLRDEAVLTGRFAGHSVVAPVQWPVFVDVASLSPGAEKKQLLEKGDLEPIARGEIYPTETEAMRRMELWAKGRVGPGEAAIQESLVPEVTFLGEQDGKPERQLKARLTSVIAPSGVVARAYLARVTYSTAVSPSVALCLRTSGAPDMKLLRALGNVFTGMFGSGQHLDMIILKEEEEGRVSKVCRPFFVRSETARS